MFVLKAGFLAAEGFRLVLSEPSMVVPRALGFLARLGVYPPRPSFASSEEQKRDSELRGNIRESSKEAGLLEREKTDSETAYYYGIIQSGSITTVLHYVTYSGVAAAGIAAFVRNVLGSVTEWQRLRAGRSIEILIKGKRIPITDGADVKEVLRSIEDAINSGKP